MDLITFTQALTSATQAVRIVKHVSESLQKMGKVEVVHELAEAQQSLIELISKCHELTTENHEQKKRIQELEDLLNLLPKVVSKFGLYWKEREDGSLDGPFSPHYWDLKKTLKRLSPAGRFRDSANELIIGFKCPDGQTDVTVPIAFLSKRKVFSDEELTALRGGKQMVI